MKKYLLQTISNDGSNDVGTSVALATAQQIIDAFGLADCSGDKHAVFDIGVFGHAEPLTYVPAVTAPFNYHEFVDSRSEVIFSGFSAEH